MKISKQSVIDQLVDPKSNKRLVSMTTYAILTAVAVVMTVLNIFTHKGALTYSTGIFAVLCAINFFLAYRNSEKMTDVASVIFGVELYALFTFFLLSGNPEGFSAIWICMAPPIGMLFYNLKKGTVFCVLISVMLIFFLWTPWGRALLPGVYTESFKTRFPLLYFAFFFLAFFLQLLRTLTWNQLDESNKRLSEQAVHDQLTKLYNRQGVFDVVREKLETKPHDSFGVVIFDIDHFKTVNDTYGHAAGDAVLVRFAEILQCTLKADVSRWGGEEFAAFFYDDDVTPGDINLVLKRVENEVFRFEDIEIRLTVSAGVSAKAFATFSGLNALIQRADAALYASKEGGRNRVSYASSIEEEAKK